MNDSPTTRAPPAPALRAAEAVLRDRFGFPGFRPGQGELVVAALEGRDSLGVLPTGGGKSICFQVPAALLRGLVLVVSPLISLMEDQMGRAVDAGLRAAVLNSTLEPVRADGIRRAALEGDLDLLFLAPERFFVRGFRELLTRLPVSLLAVDEAHCISEWGHDFRPEYGLLAGVREALSVPVMALTATATPRVRAEIVASLRLRDPVRVVLGFDRPNLLWRVLPSGRHARRVDALHALLRSRRDGAAIIYAPTRRSVAAVRRDLARLGHPVRAYHAGLESDERSRTQTWFLSESAPVVVATNAFGMGIDKPDVRMVLHYQLPGSLEAYYQEAGRGGRDGAPARCVALHHRRDFRLHRRFVHSVHPPRRVLARAHRHLRRQLGPGERGTVRLERMARALGSAAGPRQARAALRALERSGLLRLYGHGGGDPEEEDPEVGLHSRPLDTLREDRLREREIRRIEAVRAFASSRGCRRREILRYFGETNAPERCSACDRCAPDLFSPVGLG